MLSSSLGLYPLNCRSDRVYCSPMSASLLHASRMLQQRIFSPFAARLLAPTCKPTQPLQLQCLKNCHAVHRGSAAAQNSHRHVLHLQSKLLLLLEMLIGKQGENCEPCLVQRKACPEAHVLMYVPVPAGLSAIVHKQLNMPQFTAVLTCMTGLFPLESSMKK